MLPFISTLILNADVDPFVANTDFECQPLSSHTKYTLFSNFNDLLKPVVQFVALVLVPLQPGPLHFHPLEIFAVACMHIYEEASWRRTHLYLIHSAICCSLRMIYRRHPPNIINILPHSPLNYCPGGVAFIASRNPPRIVYRYNRTRIQWCMGAAITCMANKQTTFTKCVRFLLLVPSPGAGPKIVSISPKMGPNPYPASPVNHHLFAASRKRFPRSSTNWQWRLTRHVLTRVPGISNNLAGDWRKMRGSFVLPLE